MEPDKSPQFWPELASYIQNLPEAAQPRRAMLDVLKNYIAQKLNQQGPLQLHFICTHNSRRSQLAQVWAQTLAAWFHIPLSCYSGGVETTAFNPRGLDALRRCGFHIQGDSHSTNPVYQLAFAPDGDPIRCFSKTFDHPANPVQNFTAVMTCAEADANCPTIPGAEKRIALSYEDPKKHDHTAREASMYDACNRQIAAELFYVLNH